MSVTVDSGEIASQAPRPHDDRGAAVGEDDEQEAAAAVEMRTLGARVEEILGALREVEAEATTCPPDALDAVLPASLDRLEALYSALLGLVDPAAASADAATAGEVKMEQHDGRSVAKTEARSFGGTVPTDIWTAITQGRDPNRLTECFLDGVRAEESALERTRDRYADFGRRLAQGAGSEWPELKADTEKAVGMPPIIVDQGSVKMDLDN